jgi:Scd6-like Sm domain
VALEQVVSYGTEGRRTDDIVAPSDKVYDYIVFRGSDVKDLRIGEGPKDQPPQPPQVPDDPAILSVSLLSSDLSHFIYLHKHIYMMKYLGCKQTCLRERKPHVEISVAFLLICAHITSTLTCLAACQIANMEV